MNDIQAIQQNLNKTITRAKKQGIVGMSIQNLKQITPTKGVTCPVQDYDRLFSQALNSLKLKNFEITV